MRYRLRRVADLDREWLYGLKREAYREVVERQFGTWDEAVQRRMFEQGWRPEISRIVVVDDADVGLLAVEERPEEFFLAEIQLITAAQGRGLGSQIVRDLLQRARGRGKPITLQVLHENAGARRLYERLGFSQTDATDTHFVLEAL